MNAATIAAEDVRLSNKEASKYLGVCTRALMLWRQEGKGPRTIKLGHRLYFMKSDLDAFIESCTIPAMTVQDDE